MAGEAPARQVGAERARPPGSAGREAPAAPAAACPSPRPRGCLLSSRDRRCRCPGCRRCRGRASPRSSGRRARSGGEEVPRRSRPAAAEPRREVAVGGAGAGDGAAALSAGAAASFAFEASAAEGGSPAATLSPSSPRTATTVLIGTVFPSSTRTSSRTPDAGAGISASTLSVEISKSGSSRFTDSPGFFSHFVSVPSAIDSPICGMMTFVGMGPL